VLDLDSAAKRLYDAREFRDDAVPSAAEDVPPMRRYRLINHRAVHPQSGGRAFFAKLSEVAITLHIGCKNCSKPTLHGRTSKWRKLVIYQRWTEGQIESCLRRPL
jgi:hypothetical protein